MEGFGHGIVAGTALLLLSMFGGPRFVWYAVAAREVEWAFGFVYCSNEGRQLCTFVSKQAGFRIAVTLV